jgi:hypothetical protein
MVRALVGDLGMMFERGGRGDVRCGERGSEYAMILLVLERLDWVVMVWKL